VTYPGFTPVGNATLVVANVLTCNKHSQNKHELTDPILYHTAALSTGMRHFALSRKQISS
jgi:hypothetical protein